MTLAVALGVEWPSSCLSVSGTVSLINGVHKDKYGKFNTVTLPDSLVVLALTMSNLFVPISTNYVFICSRDVMLCIIC